MIPRATYRLQFHKDFPFAAAGPLAPYLAALGISHVYASPIATARRGTMHGYDVVDPTRVNPELGGEARFRSLAAALRREGLGVILDIVPNHMAVGGDDNAWWMDVLEKGESSPHAGLFDIDWRGPDTTLQGKVLAPFLGAPYGEALEAGDVRLAQGPDGAIAAVAYGAHRFPIRREDYAEVLARGLGAYDPATAEGRQRLHDLFERQHWRLAWWRTAGDEIDWRRFFDISGLAGLRMETQAAFDLVHGLPLRLYAEGLLDGLRVDHVDGLADPAAYCRKLRARMEALRPGRPGYLVVEKILGRGEALAPDWGVDGTTGYDFLDEASRLLHDPAGETPLAEAWARLSGRPADFETEERAARAEILQWSFSGQLRAAARAFHRLAAGDLAHRDVTPEAIERALRSLATVFPVYRTYATAAGLPARDTPVLERAIEAARPLQAPGEDALLDQIAAWLKGEDGGDPELRARAARRWQQLTAPVAAKSVEDTAFYRYGRLISRNDVGSDPAEFAANPVETHAALSDRATQFPNAMLATATHDHKRGEDARARLAVLSEIPDQWLQRSGRWRELNRSSAEGVDPADEAMVYQTLVGAWPLAAIAKDADALAALADRVAQWQEKALREAKLRSSWAAPDETYEALCHRFLERILDPAIAADFLVDLDDFVRRIAPVGALNGLAQTLLRCASPGVPDLFQGAEFWDFSLVDPDNRRPVDFGERQAALDRAAPIDELMASWRDGRVKQALIQRILAVRKAAPDLFAEGGYRALTAQGRRASSVFAFVRQTPSATAIGAVTIRAAEAVIGRETPVAPAAWWGDTEIVLPPDLGGRTWTDVLSEASVTGPKLKAASLLDRLPVSLLVAT